MSFHSEILPPEQREALAQLGRPAAECGFYLAGGTALAAHLGHRQSQDLDWFTGEHIEDPLALAKELQDRGAELHVGSVGRAALHGDVRGVRTSFLEYPHPTLAPLLAWPEVGCQLGSLDDLAAMKLLAIDQRGAKRDFIDVHALAINARPLADMLELYRRKFGVEDLTRVLYSLTYFGDAELNPMPRMSREIAWERIKVDICAWVKDIAAAEDRRS
jgi:hypothetical protein